MSDSASDAGLLSETEEELLFETDANLESERAALIPKLGERVQHVFDDLVSLYMVLSDDEFQEIFSGPEDREAAIRGSVQHVLAFLYYGLTINGDNVEYRISEAIIEAEAALGADASVNLTITRQPFLPPERQLSALQDDLHNISPRAFDHLLHEDEIPATKLGAVLSEIGFELTPTDIKEFRAAAPHIRRMPAPTLISISEEPDKDDN